MKTYQKFALMAVVSLAHTALPVSAQSPAVAPEPEAAIAPPPTPAAATTKHQQLCAQLGLKVGRTYEFMLTGNEEVHYWQIRSLGENGWILAKDSRYPATWVNLSQVIAITPLVNNGFTPERAKKPNREQR